MKLKITRKSMLLLQGFDFSLYYNSFHFLMHSASTCANKHFVTVFKKVNVIRLFI